MDITAYRHCVIGPGRLGATILAGLTEADLSVGAVGVHTDDQADAGTTPARLRVQDVAAEADVFWLAVPDDAIYGVAAQLASSLTSSGHYSGRPVAIHSSGLGSVQLLRPLSRQGARCLCLHPLQTFSGGTAAEALRDVPCAVTADEERDLELGEALADALGMRPFRLADERKTLYHLAAVVGSNLLVALESEAGRLMDEATEDGHGLEHLAPLVRTTVANLLEARTPARILTGPVARGDVGTVRSHLRLLEGDRPRLAAAYRALSLEALTLAAPHLDDEQVRTLRGALEDKTP